MNETVVALWRLVSSFVAGYLIWSVYNFPLKFEVNKEDRVVKRDRRERTSKCCGYGRQASEYIESIEVDEGSACSLGVCLAAPLDFAAALLILMLFDITILYFGEWVDVPEKLNSKRAS